MISLIDKLQVSLPTDTTVRVTRDFKAPRTLVWDCHTKPELVKRWMLGPPGWSMPVCEMDVRVGGTYLWRWRSDETGQMFGFHGDYREVEAPAKTLHAEYYDPGDLGGPMDTSKPAIIDTRFSEKNGVTSLVMVMEFSSKEVRDAAVSTGMTDGMELGYQRLDTMFANSREAEMSTLQKFTTEVTLPSDSEVCVTRSFRAPRTLVWQAHTVPALMRRWLGYPGWTMPVCEMDVRTGGKYRWFWRQGEDGQGFGFFGPFTEVNEPATLSYDQHYDPGTFALADGGAMPTDNPTRIRSDYAEQNGITTLVTVMDFGTKEARDAAIATGMTDGMEASYQRLDALVVAEQ